jgi:hypothetical protein
MIWQFQFAAINHELALRRMSLPDIWCIDASESPRLKQMTS